MTLFPAGDYYCTSTRAGGSHDTIPFFLTAAFIAAISLPMAALAHHAPRPRPPCSPRAFVVDTLETNHGETQLFIGTTTNNKLFEVFANTKSGTFTVVVTDQDGLSCAISAGDNLRYIKALPEGPEA